MLDTSRWSEVTLDVLHELHLDPKNVRLETANAQVEADIIEDLFSNEGAFELVESICTIGFLTHDIPVAVIRNQRYVVVEGNRRLAALKAIQNPMLVPQYRARIADLARSLPDRSALSRLRVLVAPTQDDADRFIAAIHTGNLRRPWTPARQAAFFQAQIDAGRTLKELIDRYPTIDVKDFVYRAQILTLFKSVNYDDPVLQDFTASKRWSKSVSTLSRIYEAREFIDITGLTMDVDGVLHMHVSEETFKRMAEVIVRGIYSGDFNTRTLNKVTSPRFQELLRQLRSIRRGDNGASPRAHGSSESWTSGENPSIDMKAKDELFDAGQVAPSATGSSHCAKASFGSRRSRTKRHLNLSQVECAESYPLALRHHVDELSRLNYREYPNAAALLIRATLEKSIKAYAEACGEDIRRALDKNPRHHIQLGDALAWLRGHLEVTNETSVRQLVDKLRSEQYQDFVGSSQSLNAVAHNHRYHANSEEVWALWNVVEPIMRHLMKP